MPLNMKKRQFKNEYGSKNCLESFESMVQKKLTDGWNVAGGVSITYQEQKNCYLYSQAMTRPKPAA